MVYGSVIVKSKSKMVLLTCVYPEFTDAAAIILCVVESARYFFRVAPRLTCIHKELV